MPGGGNNVYRFGPFELDAPRGCLFRGTTRVRLRESQFAILVYLVSHVGEVVAKDDLVNASRQIGRCSRRAASSRARSTASAASSSRVGWPRRFPPI